MNGSNLHTDLRSLRAVADEQSLREAGASLYVILDGASPYVSVKALYDDDISLYPVIPHDYKMGEERFFLPHICAFDNGRMLEFCKRQTGNGSFLLVCSSASITEVISHLSMSVFATIYKNHTTMFRFYDPNVLQAFMTCASQEQRDVLFGDVIACFYGEQICDALHKDTVNAHGMENIAVFRTFSHEQHRSVKNGSLAFTEEQIAVFTEQRYRYFLDWLALFIRNTYDYSRADVDRIAENLKESVNAMRSYGIGTRSCMEKYVSCCVERGWNFLRERPDAMRVVASPGIPDNYKERVLGDLLLKKES